MSDDPFEEDLEKRVNAYVRNELPLQGHRVVSVDYLVRDLWREVRAHRQRAKQKDIPPGVSLPVLDQAIAEAVAEVKQVFDESLAAPGTKPSWLPKPAFVPAGKDGWKIAPGDD